MTFINHKKVTLLLLLALLAALLIPVMGFAAGQTITLNDTTESGAVDNAQTDLGGVAIACSCGDPGGGTGGGCC